MNKKLFQCYCGHGVLWFRFFGYGLHFRRSDGFLLFSERLGYKKYFVFLGIKIKTLKSKTKG